MNGLKTGQSFHSVSRAFSIPRCTLQRHYKGEVINPGEQHLGRFRVTLTEEFENELVAHALNLQRRFYGMTPLDLCRLAYKTASKQNVHHQFNHEKEMAGRKWLSAFLICHPDLAVRQPGPTSISRAVGFNQPQVQRFFDLVRSEFKGRGIARGDQVYNMDESGLTVVQTQHRIIAKKGQKQVGRITSAGRGKTVTILCSVNSAGSFIPPLMIFPRKNMTSLLLKDSPPGTVSAASVSGWTDSKIFLQWLQHFVDHAKPSADRKIILFVDGE